MDLNFDLKNIDLKNIKLEDIQAKLKNVEKKILTKDSSGVVTDYNLSVKSIFTINFKNIIKIVELEESINVKKKSDNYELNIYERNIKRNFASSIREKLILKIKNINDN